jgi:hypothetical protein
MVGALGWFGFSFGSVWFGLGWEGKLVGWAACAVAWWVGVGFGLAEISNPKSFPNSLHSSLHGAEPAPWRQPTPEPPTSSLAERVAEG